VRVSRKKKRQRERKKRTGTPKSPPQRLITLGEIAQGTGTDAMLNRPNAPPGLRYAPVAFIMCNVPPTFAVHGDAILRNSFARGHGAVTADARVEQKGGAEIARISGLGQATVSIKNGLPADPVDGAERFTKLLGGHLTKTAGVTYIPDWEREPGRGVDGQEHVDGKLTPPASGPPIRLQLRNVSGRLAASLGKSRGASELALTATTIQEAIDAKERVDPNEKRRMHLVLYCPVSLGEPFRVGIGRTFDAKGWCRVWLCTPDEEPLMLAETAD
jgi:hypothetical protein